MRRKRDEAETESVDGHGPHPARVRYKYPLSLLAAASHHCVISRFPSPASLLFRSPPPRLRWRAPPLHTPPPPLSLPPTGWRRRIPASAATSSTTCASPPAPPLLLLNPLNTIDFNFLYLISSWGLIGVL